MLSNLKRKRVELADGKFTMMYVIPGKSDEDQYHIWVDLHGFHRWALVFWPDDGMGIKCHGKEMALEKAVRACQRNDEFRREIYG